jgi:hypothetical protein
LIWVSTNSLYEDIDINWPQRTRLWASERSARYTGCRSLRDQQSHEDTREWGLTVRWHWRTRATN